MNDAGPACWVCSLPMIRKAGKDWLCMPCQVMVTLRPHPPAALRPTRLEYLMNGTWVPEPYVDHGAAHQPVP